MFLKNTIYDLSIVALCITIGLLANDNYPKLETITESVTAPVNSNETNDLVSDFIVSTGGSNHSCTPNTKCNYINSN